MPGDVPPGRGPGIPPLLPPIENNGPPPERASSASMYRYFMERTISSTRRLMQAKKLPAHQALTS